LKDKASNPVWHGSRWPCDVPLQTWLLRELATV
jgi:hypothetical protein